MGPFPTLTDFLSLLQTALHLAVILGLPGFVRKLRAAGAGLGLQERGGHTALHLACREGQPHCAQHLLGGLGCPLSEEERAQLESVNYDGKVGESKASRVGPRHLGARGERWEEENGGVSSWGCWRDVKRAVGERSLEHMGDA